MNNDMQSFGHRESAYARPTQAWSCGRKDACKEGPNKAGACPFKEAPCSPVSSVKFQKRRIAFWTFGLAIALLTMFLGRQALLPQLSPGPLSVNHAEIAGCKDCHSAANEPKIKWLTKAITLNSHNDDKKCLECHVLGDTPFSPHSTAKENFSKRDTPASFEHTSNWKIDSASLIRNWTSQNNEDVSCAVCHREHQGKFAPIDSFDVQQCHVCHETKFTDLESDHPQYTNFPHTSPTKIKFDHVSHLEKHFYEDDYFDISPDGCKSCHDTDQTGEWMLSRGFEETCADCHLPEILGDARAGAKGVAVLSIPEIDVETLKAAGYNIGEWPEWAEGGVASIMQLLLPKSLQNSVALQDTSLKLYDLTSASPDQLESVAELAWGIKQLFYDIQMGGTELMNYRLNQALDGELDQPTLHRLVSALPKDTLVNNQKEWFPSLIDEINMYLDGDVILFTAPPVLAKSRAQKIVSQDDEVVLSNDIIGDDIELGGEDISLDDDADILLEDDDIGGDISIDDDDISFSEDDDDAILLGDDDADILSSDDNIGADIGFSDDDISLNDDEDMLLEDENNSEYVPAITAASNEEWASTGGWYRDGSNIRYRPIHHADPFLKAWLQVSSKQNNAIDVRLFKSLSDETSVGNCVKCHSVIPSQMDTVDENKVFDGSDELVIHWEGFRPANVKVDFNRFSHTSHFSLMTDDGCASCHLLDEDAVDEDGKIAASFLNMDRETCTQCHQKGRAPDNCLTCHNYHVEPSVLSVDQISDSFGGGENEQ